MFHSLKNQLKSLLFKSKIVNVFFLAVVALYFFGAVSSVYMIIDHARCGADDANIILVYAKNFSSGNGIVYNTGGERVEGFTSLLYFLICSFFYLLSKEPEFLLLLANSIWVFASFAALYYGIERLREIRGTGVYTSLISVILLLLWILINPLFFGWTVVSLLDAGIYTFLITASFVFLIHNSLKPANSKSDILLACSLIFLMIVCRPEGMLWGLVISFASFATDYDRRRGIQKSAKLLVGLLLFYSISLASLILFRKLYFGYPLPNTYYAKVSASQADVLADGFGYFSEFISYYGFSVLIPLVLLTAWYVFNQLKRSRHAYKSVSLITLVFLWTAFLIPVLEGGEHFHGFRFYQSVYPLMIFPWLILLHITTDFHRPWTSFAGSLLFILAVFTEREAGWKNFAQNNRNSSSAVDFRGCISMEFNIAAASRENSRRLALFFKGKPLPSIGYGSAGGIKLNYPGMVYDMMGLNNSRLAHADRLKSGPKGHQSFNKSVFYELRPDILMPMVSSETEPHGLLINAQNYYTNTGSWDNLIFKNIFNDELFKERYVLASVSKINAPSVQCYGFFNKSYLNKLSNDAGINIYTLNNL